MIDLGSLGLRFIDSRMAAQKDIDTPAFQNIISLLRGYKNRHHSNDSGFGLEQWAWDIDNPNMAGRKWEWPWAILSGPGSGVAIDIGSGYRPFSFLLQKEYNITCVDHSQDVVSACRNSGMQAVATDITNIPLLPKSADVIYCISVLEHLDSTEQIQLALKEMGRLIKPNGRIILTMDVVDIIKDLFSYFIKDDNNIREPVNGNEILGLILGGQ